MKGRTSLRAIVVDDDVIIRGVLSTLLVDAGYSVVGEADGFQDATDVLRAQRCDVVILDLALRSGSGEDLLRRLRDEHPEVRAVVFSAYEEDHRTLHHLGAAAVFRKPDFEELEKWLRGRVEQPAFVASTGSERRRPPQPAPILPDPGPTSPSGFEPWSTFRAAVDGLWPGDAVVGFDVLDVDRIKARGDAHHLLDFRFALGRMIAPSLRTLDRVAVTPSGVVVCLLVAGHPEAPSAVYDRLAATWERNSLPSMPIGAFAHVRPQGDPSGTLGRVLGMLADPNTTEEHPLRLA